jgi:LysR family hydrogen peroxide-inducible transcriptional activator
MNLRDLRYVVAVEEHGHFGRAAQACFVSQPTLSGQIRSLEEELGVTLFERTTKSVRPTAAGARIAALARTLLEQAGAIEDAARESRDPMSGTLRLGVIPTVAPYLLPLVLGPMRKRYPRLGLVLAESLTQVLLERLQEHRIDAAIIASTEGGAEIDEILLYREAFRVAVPKGHPLADVEAVPLQALRDADVLLLADGHCLGDQVQELCEWGGRKRAAPIEGSELPARGDLRASSLETLLQLVAVGFGVTLVPELAVHASGAREGKVLTRPIDSPSAGRTVRLVFRRSFPQRSMLEAFAQEVRRHVPKSMRVS